MPWNISVLALALLCLSSQTLAAPNDPGVRAVDEQRQTRRNEAAREVNLPQPTSTGILDALPASVTEIAPLLEKPEIIIETNGLISNVKLAALLAPYQGLSLGESRISLLLRQLNAALVREGLVTSRAQLVRLDRRNNRLEIVLYPGRIESYLRDGQQLNGELQVIFPARPGDVFVLQDLEQGVQQIQRLRMFRAEADILPGQAPQTSRIDLHITANKPWWFQASLDNQGTKTTGVTRSRVMLTYENLSGHLDSLAASVVHSDRSDAFLASYALPQGYNTWSATFAASRYEQPPVLGLSQEGGSSSGILGWNRVLWLSSAGRDSIDISLSHNDGHRKIGGVELTPERLSTLRAAYSILRQGLGWRAWLEGDYVHGLSILGAQNDAADLERASPHKQFDKFEIHTGLFADLPAKAGQYIGQLDAQYAEQGLYSTEEFHLGGMNSIRGYAESIANADMGYAFRHELLLPSFRTDFLTAQYAPFLFVDHGSTRLIHGQNQKLAGTGIGIRAAGRFWSTDLILARPLEHTATMTDYGWRIHALLKIDL